ncbi:iron-sulfur cluster biosynthesis family protein [Gottfriedia solisilvae]|uniref:Core domain-containing protein n=1 Tax=Gottfriedia solisilvae TaxID=1516104 RepID=A0A8J3AW32_9BACI|nr:iron-sulfur cluster biosynthesis family protein [Gottfriedia solisilvae]GGI17927.1 hypothetical protein GCM10007380_40380 [Gottfriedia solisilvae]
MQIKFTDNAKNLFSKLRDENPEHEVFLHYEIGGCGSPLDGVLRIKLMKTIEDFYQVPTDWNTIYMSKNSFRYVDDNLTIDYLDGLSIKSPNQTYSYKLGIEIVA